MTRSRKKLPITGTTTAASDKPYKVAEHRRERRTARQIVSGAQDDTDPRLHSENYGDPWRSPKDGKTIWSATKWREKAKRK